MLLVREQGRIRVYKTTEDRYYSPADLYMRINPLRLGETFYGLMPVTEAAKEHKMMKDKEDVSAYFDAYNGVLMLIREEAVTGLEVRADEHYNDQNLTITICEKLELHHQLALTKSVIEEFQEHYNYLECEIELREEGRREEQEAYRAQSIADRNNIDDIIEECYENQLFGD